MSEQPKTRMSTQTNEARKLEKQRRKHTPKQKFVAGVSAIAIAATGYGAIYKPAKDNGDRIAALEYKTSQLEGTNQLQAKQVNQLATMLAANAGVSKEIVERQGLKSVEDLPGYGKEVAEADRTKLRAATVKLVARIPDTPNLGFTPHWRDSCTGLKVEIAGQAYVATARHCFDQNNFGQRFGAIKGGGNPKHEAKMEARQHEALNITGILSDEYGVETVGPNGKRSSVAKVDAVAAIYYPDMALAKVDTASPAATSFNAAPAFSYDTDLARLDGIPEPGSSTVVFSLPQAAGGDIIEGHGVYLGRLSDPDNSSRMLDIVGTNPGDPYTDACNYGASGSGALVAGGTITGPLTSRNSIGYPDGVTNTPDDVSQGVIYRLKLEHQLGIDTSSFDTVCGYSVPNQNTPSDLVSGFESPVEKYAPQPTPSISQFGMK